MSSLFTNYFFAWIENRMRYDLPCDLYGVFLSERSDHHKTLNKIVNLKQELQNKETVIEGFRKANAALNERFDTFQIEKEADICSYREAFEVASFKNDGLIASNNQLHEEVKRLKAEIYDLTHPVVK